MVEEQRFGGIWTVQKLDAVERYLGFFTTVLRRQSFRLCYIDAFSGSGNVTLKDGSYVDGSALRALKYPFEQYHFFELDKNYCKALNEKIESDYPDKLNQVQIRNSDCNEMLQKIDRKPWKKENWRGVIFLDPCAMELSWSCLEAIRRTEAFDVWYLFPFSAVSRNLPRSGEIQQANEALLDKIFGNSDWKTRIYQESPQTTLFDETTLEKIPGGLKDYILGRLDETFPTVAKNPVLLRNEKNSPMFLLCFAGSNPSKSAKGLALKGANYILEHV
jgi:three-Cys-motif partner protein